MCRPPAIWDVTRNFDRALLLQEGGPLIKAILGVYEKQGIKSGHKDNTQRGRLQVFSGLRGARKPSGNNEKDFDLRKHGRALPRVAEG
jgi:hypothetical protein